MVARRPSGALVGHHVRLDPTVHEDGPGLFAALQDDQVYAAGYGGGPTGRPQTQEQIWQLFAGRLEHQSHVPYTIRLVQDSELGSAGEVVGTTSLGDLDLQNERAHLGWTAYNPKVWASTVNAEAKLLVLGQAFEVCGFGRVKIQTDIINVRSQGAIARLGAVREGVMRRHVIRADGSHRDTVVFSILIDEWPSAKAKLVKRLAT